MTLASTLVLLMTVVVVFSILSALAAERCVFGDDIGGNDTLEDMRRDNCVRVRPGSLGGGLSRTLSLMVSLCKVSKRLPPATAVGLLTWVLP